MKITGWFLIIAMLLVVVPSLVQAEPPLLVPFEVGPDFGVFDGYLTLRSVILQLTRPAYTGLILEEMERLGYFPATWKFWSVWRWPMGDNITNQYPIIAFIGFREGDELETWELYHSQYHRCFIEYWDPAVNPHMFQVYVEVK
ncbi:MAG: hypothetical protein V1853_01780 [bacterium]